MKKIRLVYVAFFLASLSLIPVAGALDGSVNFATFKGKDQLYVEVYVHLLGKTLGRKLIAAQPDSIYMSQVEVDIRVLRDSQVIHFDRYLLDGPQSKDALDFMDTRRYALPAGKLMLEITLKDVLKPGDPLKLKYPFELSYPEGKPAISGIQLLAAIRRDSSGSAATKNGFLLEDLPYHFYHQGFGQLTYYAELYDMAGLSDSSGYTLAYTIEKKTGNGQTRELKTGYARKQPKPVEVLLGQMDIIDLESGNYQFCIRVVDKSRRVLLSECVDFQRSNPLAEKHLAGSGVANEDSLFVSAMNSDTLRYSLKAIAPLVSQTDIEYLNLVIAGNNANAQRTFLYNYWHGADPAQPARAYNEFMKVARVIDKQFASGFGYGFESDRGFTYIRYGRPDDMVAVSDDPTAPPYEIWTYYRLEKTKQSNVKFVFYNPSLAPGMFILLHSTARGELQNPNWQRVLYKNAPNEFEGPNHIDATEMQDNWNRNASNLFRDN